MASMKKLFYITHTGLGKEEVADHAMQRQWKVGTVVSDIGTYAILYGILTHQTRI